MSYKSIVRGCVAFLADSSIDLMLANCSRLTSLGYVCLIIYTFPIFSHSFTTFSGLCKDSGQALKDDSAAHNDNTSQKVEMNDATNDNAGLQKTLVACDY